jgi:hypothetical protein
MQTKQIVIFIVLLVVIVWLGMRACKTYQSQEIEVEQPSLEEMMRMEREQAERDKALHSSGETKQTPSPFGN